MEHLSLVLWICLWPIAYYLESYLCHRIRQIRNEQQPPLDELSRASNISLFIWIAGIIVFAIL